MTRRSHPLSLVLVIIQFLALSAPLFAQTTLFSDNFNRADNTDLSAATNGMGGVLIANGTLGVSNVWLEPVDAAHTIAKRFAGAIQSTEAGRESSHRARRAESQLRHRFRGRDIFGHVTAVSARLPAAAPSIVTRELVLAGRSLS